MLRIARHPEEPELLIRPRDVFLAEFPITDRQNEVLMEIIRYRSKHGYSPTVRQLRDLIGVRSTNAVVAHLDALVHHGALSRLSRHRGKGTKCSRSAVPRMGFIPASRLFPVDAESASG